MDSGSGGTCRSCTVPGQPCPNERGQQKIIRGVRTLICEHVADGGQVYFASNQLGVSKGYVAEPALLDVFQEFLELLDLPSWIRVPGNFLWAPNNDLRRKPSPGMLFGAMDRSGIWDASRILYVGDFDSDKEAAENAGVPFMWAWDWNLQGPKNPRI